MQYTKYSKTGSFNSLYPSQSGLIQYTWDSLLYISIGIRLFFSKKKMSEDLTNSVDPYEMPHAAFHMGPNCL